jgi:hypothetical protein
MKILNTKFSNYIVKALDDRMIRMVRNESGAVLILAVVLGALIVSLVAIATIITGKDMRRSANYEDSRRAFYIAEAGIEQAKFNLNNSTFDDYLGGTDLDPTTTTDNGLIHDGAGTLVGTEVTLGTTKYSQIAFDGGNYHIRVFDNEDEGTNDPAVDSDGIINIQSVGITGNGDQKTITASYRKVTPLLDFPAAITMVGPTAFIETGGNIEVDGGDTNYAWDLHGYAVTTGPPAGQVPLVDTNCPSQNAVAMEDASWTYTASDWSGNSEDGFNGKDNTSSVINGLPDVGVGQTVFTAADATALRNSLFGQCDNCMTGMPQGPSGAIHNTSGAYGTVGDPQVTYFDGNVKLTGGASGAGVLIIDGDLYINAGFDWAGIILIGACDTCWGAVKGVGDAKIYGALVVGNALDATGDFSGNAEFFYSCDAIDLAEDAIGNLSVADVGWIESD